MSNQPPTSNPQPLTWTERLRAALDPAVHALLWQAAGLATAHGSAIYLVGGPVRDLILGRAIGDIDLVIDGDAWPVAETFATATGGALTRHAAFRTATVELPTPSAPLAIDFVTARRESYAAPAALPQVTPSTIDDDLRRRDFTINALALRLEPDHTTALVDPLGGLLDLQAGVIRALHAGSFVDDPTRILRAARFAARLGFAVEPHTEAWIRSAVADDLIERTTPQRILNELWLALDEPQLAAVLALLHAWGAFDQLRLVWNDAWPAQFAALRLDVQADVAPRDLGWGVLVWPLDQRQRQALSQRYNLPTAARTLLRELDPALLDQIDQPLDDVALERALQPLSAPALRVLQIVADTPLARANLQRYVDVIRPLPPLLTGDDLRAAGIAPGPVFRTLLDRLRAAQLRGTITTRDAALRWLREGDH